MNKKFDVSIPIYWLTVESAKDRHAHMINQFFQYGIDSHTLINGYDSAVVRSLILDSIYLSQIDNKSIAIMLSHLNIIKKFYYESTADMALIFEDDISFKIVDYWPFTLQQVIDRLPANWNVIQLCLIRNEDLIDVRFRKMKDSDWSVAAYLISRKYAQTLINQYCYQNIYNVDIVPTNFNLIPCIEAVLFCLDFGNMYTFPIFTENLDISSTYFDSGFIQTIHKPLNIKSGQEILCWWETNKFNNSLDYFFNSEI